MTTPSVAALARARGLAGRAELPWLDLDGLRIDPDACDALPLHLLLDACAIPYAREGKTLLVALADPRTRALVEQASLDPVEFAVASRAAVTNALDALRQTEQSGGSLIAVADPSSVDGVELQLLMRAAEAGTSDLHFVPCAAGISVRARVDGVLRPIGEIALRFAPAAISRLKVQAKLDISDQRRSQEGRLTITGPTGRVFDVRITTLPTIAGEGAALRILERSRRPPSLTTIGLSEAIQLQLERVVNARRGALLVTGPTGSGKTTTIYAALGDIAHPDLNVVTVEDPVEYRHDGIYQLEVNPHADLSFESALRSILRSDPDVIVVGEMRDLATATTTLKAALTGSFVLSTLHTSDAPAAMTRLLDMGVEPYVTAATVTAVLAQRLVRRLCIHCRERYAPDVSELEGLGLPADSLLFRASGCEHCNRGYRGQLGVHQLMVVDDEVRRLTLARASHEAISVAAAAAGTRSLRRDALDKALAGLTTVQELQRALADEA